VLAEDLHGLSARFSGLIPIEGFYLLMDYN